MINIISISATCGINNKKRPQKACNPISFKTRLHNFGRREDGAVLHWALITIVMMMMIGGLAVDVIRAEHQRTEIQYTQDRAVLAAASLKNTSFSPGTPAQQVAQDVFNDYFAKAGISQFTPTAVVSQGLNFRRVGTRYDAGNSPTINTFLSDMIGIETLATPATATARDEVNKVEISLVLDVSGSMRDPSRSGNTKMLDLQNAAKEFVDTLLIGRLPDDDTFSISIVPYAAQVTVGKTLLDKFSVTSEHNYSHCVDFSAADFNTTAINPTGTQLQRTGHFSPDTSSRILVSDWWGTRWWDRTCLPDDKGNGQIIARHILPLSDDITALKDHIDNLIVGGWTSTDIGAKWGAALLDPSVRPVVSSLIDDDEINARLQGRPYNFTEQNVMKVMVVMTDGQNTNQFSLDPDVSQGLSPVWHRKNTSGTVQNFWVHNENRTNRPYLRMQFNQHGTLTKYHGWKRRPDADAVRLTYPELWHIATMRLVSDMFGWANIPGGWGWYYHNWNNMGWNNHYTRVNWSEKDQRLANICTAAKDNNILLFTIGFEVHDSNAVKLEACATTPAHFFRVEGLEISEAFASIASQLGNLRLIQ